MRHSCFGAFAVLLLLVAVVVVAITTPGPWRGRDEVKVRTTIVTQ